MVYRLRTCVLLGLRWARREGLMNKAEAVHYQLKLHLPQQTETHHEEIRLSYRRR